MKKSLSIILSLICLLSIIQPFSAFAATYTKDLTIGVGNSEKAEYYTSNANTFYSTNSSVAYAYKDNGYIYIKGVSVGTAEISYSDQRTTTIINVTVVNPITKNVTLTAGDYEYAATDSAYSGDEISVISSSNESVAKLEKKSSYEYDYYVHAISAGSAVLDYKINGYPYRINVTVNPLADKTLSVTAGDYAFITEAGSYSTGRVQNITSSNPEVAEIYQNYESKYFAHAIAAGTATITYTLNGTLYTVIVNVAKPKELNLTLTSGSYKYVFKKEDLEKLTSTNSKIAVLEKKSYDNKYYVHAISAGKAVLTYTNDSTVYKINVTVNAASKKSVTVTAKEQNYKQFATNKTFDYDDFSVSISKAVSSNTRVAKVLHGEYENCDNYYVYGVAPGTATITYYVEGAKFTVNVTVTKPKLSPGSKKLKIDTKNNSTRSYVYYDGFNGLKISSSNSSVVTAKIENYNLNQALYYEGGSKNYFDTFDEEFYQNHKKKGKLIHYYRLYPKKRGSATITVSDSFGNKTKFKVTVTDSKTYSKLYEYTDVDDLYSGETVLTGKTIKGSKVKLRIGNKTYKTTAKNGRFTIKKIKPFKIGTKFTVTCTSKGTSRSFKGKIKKPYTFFHHLRYFRNTNKMTGYIDEAHKGDKIKVTIGKRTYTKKLTKDVKNYKFTIKVKKYSKYGSKIKVKLVNRFNQPIATDTSIVYYSNSIYTGMTMQQASCVPGWESPHEKHYYSYGTFWWYNDNSYLYFKDGRLSSWGY